jgi:DHA3 family tetracycline resistance protein-like MFS transporter
MRASDPTSTPMPENRISSSARRLRRPGLPLMLAPLAIRDYALLFAGMTVSLLGDGIYLVAIAWQVYELSNAPMALSIVGVAWTLPLVVFVLLGGVVSDRVDRRKVMIAADLIRFAGIAVLGALSVAGALELWHVIVLVAVYGAGEAFFGPAFGAIVPDIVPRDQLVQANSLNQLMRPLAHRLVGPAVGGATIALVGAGGAFLVDAGTFVISAAALAAMQPRRPQREETEAGSVVRDIREGWRFVRERTWLWGTLIAASITLLVFWGPHEVLIPYIVKNDLGGGAAALGLVFAAGGVGSVLAAIAVGQRGLPRRHITFMYVAWTLGGLAIAGYGVASALWQAMAVSFVVGALDTAGLIVWGTMIHRLVPSALLGRVESFDWLVSIALVPVSFAVTGPIAAGLGAQATLVGAGILGALGTIAFLFLPGMRDLERRAPRAALGHKSG